ncbi:hypothetical protein SBV1_3270010 [Verrucomicrobia bacterium]|nr:hypothetical protein SBV1_3270010 [Verrucomicrobiota bacterium]
MNGGGPVEALRLCVLRPLRLSAFQAVRYTAQIDPAPAMILPSPEPLLCALCTAIVQILRRLR